MIKISGIYHKIISKENLYQAAYMAAKARRYTDSVAEFNFHLEEEIEMLQMELKEKNYNHGQYRVFTVYDPKERKIAAAPFRDRVVHHAAHDVIEPLIDKTFVYHSFACRKNKGTHKAIDWAQKFLKLNAFCFHGDIKKYFFSIDRAILKDILRKRIEDQDLLWLLDKIIGSATYAGEQKGLPIGNLTSQFFANLYLNELDYFVKFDLGVKFYIRYMDDFIVFENDKEKLVKFKEKIRDFLKIKLMLELHEGKSQVYNTKSGIKFLGFRIFENHKRLATNNVRRFKKRLKKFGYLLDRRQIKERQIRDSVRCWVAHSSYANTNGLRLNIFNDLMGRDKYFGGLLKDVLCN
ncbi:MAG: Group II intron-encoded protein LtrA [Candidatus Omnitrophica bacterium ADurb.Bin205]|nr:MAG: Group II intron-encoded protein LtrA [Candidatus Omnitrophica bacterium ADurb.Bin205]